MTLKKIIWPPGRRLLGGLAIAVAFLMLWPLIVLLLEGLQGVLTGSANLGTDGARQIKGTILLLLGTGVIGGIIGTINGWLLANCRFPGRKVLRIAQLIPLATPAYILSATLIDLGSINAIRIYGMGWGILIMALTTYPYVFLLSTESFSISGRRQLEACRSLGVGPWNSFRRIALPMAMPAIGAGVALMSMEVVNELGAVQLLNIPSISAGIVENWISKGNPSGAIALAIIALAIVMTFVAYEKMLRKRSKRWSEGIAGGESPQWPLHGIRALSAQTVTALPPLFTLGVPLLWASINFNQLNQGINIEMFLLTARTIGLAILTALITLSAALLLALAKRLEPNKWMKSLTFLAGIGYAIPGAVLALAMQSLASSPIKLNAICLLLWGYVVRFLLVGKGGLDAGFERISPNLDEAARGLGCSWAGVFRRIHWPLQRGPLTVGLLLIFVDTIKELPLTFILRPFDFDTLSVRIFQYASDERMAECIIPTMIILIMGLISSLALVPGLEKKQKSNLRITKI